MSLRITGLLLSLFFWLNSISQQVGFDVYSLEDGLPKLGVYDITQDKDGYLWIATEGGGVSKFDGYTFKTYTAESGLSDNMVRTVFCDSVNRIWIGTQSGGINLIINDSIIDVPETKGMHVRSIGQMDDGLLLFGTMRDGVYTLNPETFEIVSLELHIPNIRSVLNTRHGILVGTDEGLFGFHEDSLIELPGSTRRQTIISLFEDSRGMVWIATSSGFHFYDGQGATESPPKNILSQIRIKSICEDGNGAIWLGTRQGAYKISQPLGRDDEWQFVQYTEKNGLGNDRIRKIYRDRNNALWFATYFGGISRLTEEGFLFYGQESGLPATSITALHYSNDQMWVGTYSGEVYEISNGNPELVFEPINSEAPIRDIYFHPTNRGLYIAASENGLVEILPNKEPIITNGMATCVDGHNQDIIIALDGKIRWWWRPEIESPDIPQVEQLHVSSDGDLYVGTVSGLYFSSDPFEEFLLTSKTDSSHILSISEDSQGIIWIGTESDGFFKCKGHRARKFNSNNYLNSHKVHMVAPDELDNLWIADGNGISYIELDPEQKVVLDDTHWQPSDGFTGGEVNQGAGLVDRQGQMWFGTVQGMMSYTADKSYVNPNPPELRLEDVRIFYESPDWQQFEPEWSSKSHLPSCVQVPHEKNHFSFYFTAIDLSDPTKVRYQYFLDGQEQDWRPISSEKKVTYSDLQPGEYEFKVRSRNSQGIWNEDPITFKLEILPPLYQQLWFQILVAALIVIIVWGAVRIRVRMLEREKRNLEMRVSERTSELEKEKKKSEDLLLNILPSETADELKNNGYAQTRQYDMVSVLFSDFKGFTIITEDMDSGTLVATLDRSFKSFDRVTEKFKVEKIKTIGDAYMCASGLPAEDPQHASNLVQFAQEMIKAMEEINEEFRSKNLPTWNLRIGIHSGPVVAGVVGEKKFAYDIWGDTVNTAARMESSGEPGKINISEATYALVRDEFDCEPRGKVGAKNKGELEMYYVGIRKKEM